MWLEERGRRAERQQSQLSQSQYELRGIMPKETSLMIIFKEMAFASEQATLVVRPFTGAFAFIFQALFPPWELHFGKCKELNV